MTDSEVCMKKIGILGGTFNPIHNGHMEMACQAAEEFELEKILIMPNNIPAYKDNEDIVSATHRFAMAKLAAEAYPDMEASDMEIKREGITYTSDTLRLLSEKYPGIKWYFIIGGDSLIHFDEWHEPDSILKLSALVVAVRGGISREQIKNKIDLLKNKYKYAEILLTNEAPVNVSSTEIRQCIKSGKSISGLVPDRVFNYIMENGLYKNAGE